MKWIDEKENLIEYISLNMSYEEIGRKYGITGTAVKKAAIRLGINLPKRRKINPNEKFDKTKKKDKELSVCLYCGKRFIKYSSSNNIYCSVKCSIEHHREQRIQEWKQGKIDGTSSYYCCSTFVRNYLLRKHNYKCEKCGWGEINIFTNRVPLQIHHIDGNSENNVESNLQVLCPNCHSLTENFGSRNKDIPEGKSEYFYKNKGKRKTD